MHPTLTEIKQKSLHRVSLEAHTCFHSGKDHWVQTGTRASVTFLVRTSFIIWSSTRLKQWWIQNVTNERAWEYLEGPRIFTVYLTNLTLALIIGVAKSQIEHECDYI